MVFSGDFSELISLIKLCGETVVLDSFDNGFIKQAKTLEGLTINLYRTGTVQVQGSPAKVKLFIDKLEKHLGTDECKLGPLPQLFDTKRQTAFDF